MALMLASSHHSVFAALAFLIGLIGLGLAMVAMADSRRVAARNAVTALGVVVGLFVLAPQVLCCWCPPDPTWWQCVLNLCCS